MNLKHRNVEIQTKYSKSIVHLNKWHVNVQPTWDNPVKIPILHTLTKKKKIKLTLVCYSYLHAL